MLMSVIKELAIGSYNQQLSYAQQPSGREAWMKEERLKEGRPSATMTPRQPDRMGREPQPPRRKSEACGATRGGKAKAHQNAFRPNYSAGAKRRHYQISGWLAGRWRLHGGCRLDVALLVSCDTDRVRQERRRPTAAQKA